jgi:sulfite reductase alpha subunit-like flavoprotein
MELEKRKEEVYNGLMEWRRLEWKLEEEIRELSIQLIDMKKYSEPLERELDRIQRELDQEIEYHWDKIRTQYVRIQIEYIIDYDEDNDTENDEEWICVLKDYKKDDLPIDFFIKNGDWVDPKYYSLLVSSWIGNIIMKRTIKVDNEVFVNAPIKFGRG